MDEESKKKKDSKSSADEIKEILDECKELDEYQKAEIEVEFKEVIEPDSDSDEGLEDLSPEEKDLVLKHRAQKKKENKMAEDHIKKLENNIYNHQQMMEEEVERQKKQMVYSLWGILAFFVIFGVGSFLFITKSYFRYPFVYLIGIGIILFIAWLIILGFRCPSCKRHFARQGKEFVTSYQNTRTVTLEGGGTSQEVNTVHVYKVHCKFCGHEWVILR